LPGGHRQLAEAYRRGIWDRGADGAEGAAEDRLRAAERQVPASLDVGDGVVDAPSTQGDEVHVRGGGEGLSQVDDGAGHGGQQPFGARQLVLERLELPAELAGDPTQADQAAADVVPCREGLPG